MRLLALTVATCLAATVVALAPSAAFADADPPSDVLLGRDVYLPYVGSTAPQHGQAGAIPSEPTNGQLNRLLAIAKARHHGYKVAVIATQADLGGIPALFGKFRQYAIFLSREIQPFVAHEHATLVVVMPNGLAMAGPDATAAGRAALARIPRPRSASLPDEIATAVAAVRDVSAANGRPLPYVAPTATSGGGGGSHTGTRLLVLGLAALALVAGIGIAVRTRLRYGRSTDGTPAS